jgi:hypothetical protein
MRIENQVIRSQAALFAAGSTGKTAASGIEIHVGSAGALSLASFPLLLLEEMPSLPELQTDNTGD